MASRGVFAQMHEDIALDVAAIQAQLLSSIQKDFFEPEEPETDWAKVLRRVEESKNDPVKRALVNRELAEMLPDLFEQARASLQEQPGA